MRKLEKWAIGVLVVACLAASALTVYAGGSWQSCTRTTSAGSWGSYAGGAECGSFWMGWGSPTTDRCRWSTSSAGVARDMYLTYRHLFKGRTTGDSSADHWSYAEGSYSGDVGVNQRGFTTNSEATINARASYNGDDWLEVGSDGGGSMDTIAEKAKFYPEYDATYSTKSYESYMYAGNVYQWRYVMVNPSSAWGSWGSPIRFAHTGGVTEGPGWYSAGRVNNGPGTGPGGTMDLYFNMRPTTTGDYNEDFQMVYEGVSWFGDKVGFSNDNMRTWTRLSRKAPGAIDGWDNGPKKKGETVRFYIAGADSWGTGNSYSWDWDGTTSQGWGAGNACTVTQEDSNDRMRINITGADPYCYSSGGLAINADNCKYLTIRMWSNGGSDAQLFWSSSTGGWSGDRHIDWSIIADSQWHVYRVALPASWSGTVYQLRLDPIGTGAANGQTVYVDWLRIHHVSDGMSAKAWLGTSNNNWDIYSSSAMSWDSSANAWYKDYTITGNYPQTYYCAMHVYNNNAQHCDNDADRKYGDNYRTYTMANTAPTVSNANYTGDGWTADNTPSLSWNYADADSNAQTQRRVQVDNNSDFSSPELDTGNVGSADNTYTTTTLGDGQWYWRVMVNDGYDSSSWSSGTGFRVDATGPTTPTINGVVVDELNATVSFSGSTDANSFHYEIKLDSGSYATATSPKAYTNLSGGSHTVYVKAVDSLGNESGVASRGFTIDSIPPTVDNISVTPQFVGSAGYYLQGYLYVDANVADTGGSNLASVQTSRDGGLTYDTMPAKTGDPEHNYEKIYTIDGTWANGANSIIIKATDGAGNVTTTSPTNFNVNKNEIEVTIGLQGWNATGSVGRSVTFALNGTTVLAPIEVQFLPPGNSTVYRLRDFTDATGSSITSLSAKTAWTLRKKVSVVSLGNGQYTANMTGSSTVAGGDLNGDNVVNALDYSVLRSVWGQFSAGDITGDGWTNNADYLILKSNWYKRGEAL